MDEVFTTIREVDPALAEAVLAVRLFIPDVVATVSDEYYLARTIPHTFVVEPSTRTVNADESIREMGTCTTESGGGIHRTYADGRTEDGRGCGFGKTLFIEGRSAEAVAVHLSMYWTDHLGRRGSLDEDLLVPWLGESRCEVAGGWIEARITQIPGRTELGAAAAGGGM